MAKDKCVQLRWSVAEKVMRTVKSLAESPAKEILGEKFMCICGLRSQRLLMISFATINVNGHYHFKISNNIVLKESD